MLHLVLWLLKCKSKYILQLCRQQLVLSTPFFHTVLFRILMIHIILQKFENDVLRNCAANLTVACPTC